MKRTTVTKAINLFTPFPIVILLDNIIIICCRMTVVSFGDYNEVDKTWETGILSLYLSPDEVHTCIFRNQKLNDYAFLCLQEKSILTLDNPVKFPLYISVNMALVAGENL